MQSLKYLMLGLVVICGGLLMVMESEAEDDAARQIVEGNSIFAFSLYSQLKDGEGNLFFSPYSISSALAMTYGGARKETAVEMAEALHFGLKQEFLHPAFAELASQFEIIQKAGNVALTVANALWLQEGIDLLEEYATLTKEHYEAGVFQVNFEKASEDARKSINAWVEERTQGKIQDLLIPGSISEATRLVLTNAIYFKGRWEIEFEKELTKEEAFWLSPDKKIQVPLMQQQNIFKYGETATAQLLQLPYSGGELAMLIVLPQAQDGLAALETELTPEGLESWLQELAMREVNVVLPRFTTNAYFDLSETLQALGMSKAFTEAADFSGIDGTQQLSISSVLHKAFVEVTEEGTEAAAATAAAIGVTSIQDPAPIPEFRADHPFLYLIRDNGSGSILFLGRCMNPAK
ncbi:MAG: serpin family protein [bacterium]|nr:serpin family protein [bacterium]